MRIEPEALIPFASSRLKVKLTIENTAKLDDSKISNSIRPKMVEVRLPRVNIKSYFACRKRNLDQTKVWLFLLSNSVFYIRYTCITLTSLQNCEIHPVYMLIWRKLSSLYPIRGMSKLTLNSYF